jgi:F0F1-type ATP synthase assembly protein I
MKEEKMFKNIYSIKGLMLGAAAYSGASIFGPLLLFGVLGFFLDKFFDTKPIFLLIGLLIAFIITNILIFRRTSELSKKFDKYLLEEKNKNKDK